jgi:hypothetical protein
MHHWLPILISRLLSLLQASSLRERYYTALNRVEILETALSDIERIYANTPDPDLRERLIRGIISNTRKL